MGGFLGKIFNTKNLVSAGIGFLTGGTGAAALAAAGRSFAGSAIGQLVPGQLGAVLGQLATMSPTDLKQFRIGDVFSGKMKIGDYLKDPKNIQEMMGLATTIGGLTSGGGGGGGNSPKNYTDPNNATYQDLANWWKGQLPAQQAAYVSDWNNQRDYRDRAVAAMDPRLDPARASADLNNRLAAGDMASNQIAGGIQSQLGYNPLLVNGINRGLATGAVAGNAAFNESLMNSQGQRLATMSGMFQPSMTADVGMTNALNTGYNLNNQARDWYNGKPASLDEIMAANNLNNMFGGGTGQGQLPGHQPNPAPPSNEPLSYTPLTLGNGQRTLGQQLGNYSHPNVQQPLTIGGQSPENYSMGGAATRDIMNRVRGVWTRGLMGAGNSFAKKHIPLQGHR